MSGRQGGKVKPLKAPKKDKKDLDEDDIAFQQKKKQEEAALKAARDKGAPFLALRIPYCGAQLTSPTAAKGGAPGGGIKKSGKS
ncbi:translation machinery associated TMA7-domain-containing protein [Fomes fomentarius]|nr:translation machinery associated TMA7-domain-containing protein [Fomes fomentarius]